jgi:hypothetical protein
MRQCPQCHRVYSNEVAFCLEDGTLLTDTRDSEQAVVKTAYLSTPAASITPAKKKGHKVAWVVATVTVAALLIIGGLLLGMNLNSPDKSTASVTPTAIETALPPSTPIPERPQLSRSTPTPATPTPEPTSYPTHTPALYPTRTPAPPPTSVPVTPEFVELEPSQSRWYPFSIGSNGGQVGGNFIAQGGMGNDVYVFVIPQNELAAFRNNYSFNQYYESGKVHSDTFSRSLPPGSYFVIIKSPTPFTARRIRCNLSAVSN